MGLGDRVHNHKAILNKETHDDTFRNMQKPGTIEDHKSMKSNFDVIKKHDQKTHNQGNIYYDKIYSGN